MNLQRALERYSQLAKSRSTANNVGLPELAPDGQLKQTQKMLEMSKVNLEGTKESTYNFKVSM